MWLPTARYQDKKKKMQNYLHAIPLSVKRNMKTFSSPMVLKTKKR